MSFNPTNEDNNAAEPDEELSLSELLNEANSAIDNYIYGSPELYGQTYEAVMGSRDNENIDPAGFGAHGDGQAFVSSQTYDGGQEYMNAQITSQPYHPQAFVGDPNTFHDFNANIDPALTSAVPSLPVATADFPPLAATAAVPVDGTLAVAQPAAPFPAASAPAPAASAGGSPAVPQPAVQQTVENQQVIRYRVPETNIDMRALRPDGSRISAEVYTREWCDAHAHSIKTGCFPTADDYAKTRRNHAELADGLIVRPLELTVRAQNDLINLTRKPSRNLPSVYLFLTGGEALTPCRKCDGEKGVFPRCIGAWDKDLAVQTKGVCANCIYYDGMPKCNHYRGR